ncbi:AcvB/VirJ family lysyl-phosphatidylglycerol hydrolase [Sphingobacterium sp. Mn56C]|uniref:AcvB/VirJ family lysyl-phosphatidylglycerol hydrolase n=1 Tax=Sphingobacterium sp. Mn56C TaxID=3395261 RepID=UPI003BCAEF50
MAQFSTSDVKFYAGNSASLPVVFYLSGDGGWNKFSETLCETMVQSGYSVVTLNSKSYFWNKKTVTTLVNDVSAYLKQQLRGQLQRGFILVGYSFGADAVPFLVNNLPQDLLKHLKQAVMVEPSQSTDLEIHLSDMLSRSPIKRSMDVIAEINKMTSTNLCIVMGEKDANTILAKVALPKLHKRTLPGGHHFDGDARLLAKEIMACFKN